MLIIFKEWNKFINIRNIELRLNFKHVERLTSPYPVQKIRIGPNSSEFEILNRFPDQSLCVTHCLETYISRTECLRQGSQLLVSFQTPHKGISRDTLGRWTRDVMNQSGFNLDIFKPHSTRASSISKATMRSVSLATIAATVGWRNASAVAKYYNKPIEEEGLAAAVLGEYNK